MLETVKRNSGKEKKEKLRNDNGNRPNVEQPRNNEFDVSQQSANKKRKPSSSSEWRQDCLNPDHNEKHKLRDCKATTKERAKELLSEFRAKKKRKKAARCTTVGSNGKYKVLLAETETIALGDTGADFNCIPMDTMK